MGADNLGSALTLGYVVTSLGALQMLVGMWIVPAAEAWRRGDELVQGLSHVSLDLEMIDHTSTSVRRHRRQLPSPRSCSRRLACHTCFACSMLLHRLGGCMNDRCV